MAGWDLTDASSGNAAGWDTTPTSSKWTNDENVKSIHGTDNLSDKNDDGLNNSGGGGGGGDDGCHNCHQQGHFARDCPEERQNSGECYNCGEVGHNKADCPNPRVERAFTGTCRICEEQGHRAADCPTKPAEKCRNCQQEGHKASECEANRLVDRSAVPDMDKESAWKLMKQAVDEKEITEFQDALKIYVKADPNVTYARLESIFRAGGLGVYLIALDKTVPQTMTNVNLQGKTGCKYTLGYFFKPKAARPIMQQYWPETPEENMERLKDVGEMMENHVPLCRNCNELGHMSKACTQDKIESAEVLGIVCSNCSEPGHRLRDCPKERATRGGGACRNCNQEGHKAADCTEERSAANVECKRCQEMGHFAKDCPTGGGDRGCRNCGEEGHFAKDCDKPKNPANMTCRNCDEVGHSSRDCEKPKDWSRVKCNNCGEMGHTIRRCKEPIPEQDNSFAIEDTTATVSAGGW